MVGKTSGSFGVVMGIRASSASGTKWSSMVLNREADGGNVTEESLTFERWKLGEYFQDVST